MSKVHVFPGVEVVVCRRPGSTFVSVVVKFCCVDSVPRGAESRAVPSHPLGESPVCRAYGVAHPVQVVARRDGAAVVVMERMRVMDVVKVRVIM